MSAANLTLGDVLPASEKANLSADVLNIPLAEAVQYAVKGIAGNLSYDQTQAVTKIFEDYQANGGSGGSGSAYWDKNPAKSQAYWNKNPDTAYWDKNDASDSDAYWDKG